jgi:hypothetical protein
MEPPPHWWQKVRAVLWPRTEPLSRVEHLLQKGIACIDAAQKLGDCYGHFLTESEGLQPSGVMTARYVSDVKRYQDKLRRLETLIDRNVHSHKSMVELRILGQQLALSRDLRILTAILIAFTILLASQALFQSFHHP